MIAVEGASSLADRIRAWAGEGEILAVGAGALLAHLEGATVREIAAPGAEPVLLPEVQVDAVLIASLGGATPLGLARAASACVRPGGRVAFAVATTRPGLKGTAGSLLGKLRGRKPVLLEELCEALLVAGLGDIVAHELDGSSGMSVVWACAPWAAPAGQYST